MNIKKTVLAHYLKIKEMDVLQCSPITFVASPDWQRGRDAGWIVLTEHEYEEHPLEQWQKDDAINVQLEQTLYKIIQVL